MKHAPSARTFLPIRSMPTIAEQVKGMSMSAAVAYRRNEQTIAYTSSTPPASVMAGVRRLHQLFERRCDDEPTRTALVCKEATLSYGELEKRANALANFLVREGVRSGARVGILLERSVEMYVTLLAIMKAGAVYVPLDPIFPADRIAFIAGDAELVMLITSKRLALRLPDLPCRTLAIDSSAQLIATGSSKRVDLPPAADNADELCYIIYTSGTTGWPKGVAVSHRSVTDFLRAAFDVYGVRAEDRVYQGITIAFDFSIEEIWLTFVAGAVLVPGQSDDCRIGDGLARFLVDQRITVFGCVPTILATIEIDLPAVRILILGGEHCSAELIARWSRPGRQMFNTYGPTEAVVTATWTEVAPGRPVTIGRPFPGYVIYILDPELRQVAQGDIGEIHIGGIGVACGYINRPELTREKFIPDPFAGPHQANARLYKSGDLGRLTPEGDIECLGRIDTQVKVRGFRLELTEIEAVLLEEPAVENAIVSLWQPADDNRELVAYLVPRVPGGRLPLDALTERLRQRLPSYMMPAFLEPISAIPMLANGKADRLGLPAPQSSRLAFTDRPHVAPEGQLEATMVAIWCTLLKRTQVSVDDDFFLDLGGHSLLAAQVVSQLRRRSELADVGIGELYAHPTIRRLAAHIARRSPANGMGVERNATRAAKPLEAPAAATSGAAAADRRVFRCGVAQALALYALMVVPAAPFTGLLYASPAATQLSLLSQVLLAGALVLALLIVALAISTIVPVVVKWTVIGRYRAGSYPLWGSYYFRWWLVQKVQLLMAPLTLFAGSPLLPIYARVLGAKIGRNCHIAASQLLVPDMIDIGEGTSVGHGTYLCGYRIADGMLHIGPVRIGKSCYVGTASLLLPGAIMEDATRLGDQSLLSGGQTVPAGESWAGSPGRRDSFADPMLETLTEHVTPEPGRMRRAGLLVGYLATLILLSLLVVLAAIPGAGLLIWVHHSYSGLWYLLATLPAAVTFVLLFCLAAVGFKRLVLPDVAPGIYSIHSTFYLRKWAIDRLMDMTLAVTNAIYSTLYIGCFLRLLGASIGRHSEVSTVSHITPNLLRIDDESFVADSASIGPARVFNSAMMLAPTRIGYRSFVGNVALLKGGGSLRDNCLLGALSVLPGTGTQPGTDWLGSPAMFLPRRQASQTFSDSLIYNPSRQLYAERLAIEFFRIVVPPTLWFAAGSFTLDMSFRVASLTSLGMLPLLIPMFWLISAATTMLIVVLIKQFLIGTYQPLVRPLWHRFVRRTELMTGLYESVATPIFLGLLTGTPLIAAPLRLFGVKIGRRVCMETTHITEFDLVNIGDDSAIGLLASLQTHLFEDRVMKLSDVTIGRGCTVGARGVVLYDSIMEDGSALDALSLLMKGEVLPAGTQWRGVPAQRIVNRLQPVLLANFAVPHSARI